MKRMIQYVFLFLTPLLFSCKSDYRKAADEIMDHTPDPVNMNAGKAHYSLYVPKTWTTENKVYRGINMYFLSAPKTNDDPNTSVNVITEYMQGLSLEVYTTKSIESLKRSVPIVFVLDRGSIEANGIKGEWYSYNMVTEGIKSSLVSYIFPRNGAAYIITAGTQPEDATRYRKLFDLIAMSLRFDK